LESQTGLLLCRERLFLVTGWPKDLTGQNMLEVGSGAARFTEILVRSGATVFSFDCSSAADANRANNGAPDNLCLFQADIFHIPRRPKSFDKILYLGLLQHTADPDAHFLGWLVVYSPKGNWWLISTRNG
jgi:2-polyprenyl-3-methyl-5-hydroxy-6-metoxy-1,4-benzoquinol methylase